MDPHQQLIHSYLRGRKDLVAFSALPDAPTLPPAPPRRTTRALGWLRSTASEAVCIWRRRRFTVAPCISPPLGQDR